jgi:hypothetical protein
MPKSVKDLTRDELESIVAGIIDVMTPGSLDSFDSVSTEIEIVLSQYGLKVGDGNFEDEEA